MNVSSAAGPSAGPFPMRPVLLWIAAGAAVVLLGACAASHHASAPSALGQPSSSEALRAHLAEPGPIEFEKVLAADWAVDRSGLINLEHPKARAAGLVDGAEQIQIFFYVLRHPTRGTFIVDSGLETGFLEPEKNPRVGFLIRRAMDTDALDVHRTTAQWIAGRGGRLDGVFLTHLHLDHIMGLPDVPPGTPIYTGPGETTSAEFLNAFTRGTTDRMLEGQGPMLEWQFAPDPDGRFDGVIDVFGDGSLFALHVPGHTPGSTAFAVRTTEGPVLLLGDSCHTAWGWENGVEPGTFSRDQPRSAESLKHLLDLAASEPSMRVHPGHQSLGDPTPLAHSDAR